MSVRHLDCSSQTFEPVVSLTPPRHETPASPGRALWITGPRVPNRILRDGILRSEAVAQLSPQAELFYRRLMSVVDDFGRYYARPELLLSDCYPIRPTWADVEAITLWLAECRQFGLVVVYKVNGVVFLEVARFGQRLRADQRSKFPEVPAEIRDSREFPASRARTTTTTTTASPPTEGGLGETKILPRSDLDELFVLFRESYAEIGAMTTEADWQSAYWAWKVLDSTQKMAAIVHAKACDPVFIRLPRKYLETREWERKPRPSSKRETEAERLARL